MHPSHRGHPGPVTAQPNCGPSDSEYGYCLSRYHTMGCGSLATAEMAGAVKEPLQASGDKPPGEERGEPWVDPQGEPGNILGGVEARGGPGRARFSAGPAGS